MSKTLSIVIIALAVVLIFLLAVVFFIVLRQTLSSQGDASPTLVSTAAALVPTSTEGAEQPTSDVDVPPTFTIEPTPSPTNSPLPTTPEPTATPLPTSTIPPTRTPVPPTNTPIPPTPTSTPVPVVPVVPTNTPVPPAVPTNTPVPAAPTNTPVPQPPSNDTRGLAATNFRLQSRSSYTVNGRIWFEFDLVNTAGYNIPYKRLGVMPNKDGADRHDWFQQSYGGPNASIKPSGLSHEDNLKLPEKGTYTLRLAICFDDWDGCNSGGGNWASLSAPTTVNIN